MFIVVAKKFVEGDAGIILGSYTVLKDARRMAFRKSKPHQRILIYDDSDVKPIFIPSGQKVKCTIGERIAEILQPEHLAGVKLYFPTYDSKYYKKHKVKYHEYILKADGSLGKGRRW